VDIAKNGTHFYVKIGENRESFETPVLGRHNVLNILGAALASQALGMTIEEIQKRVKTLKPLPHTLNAESGINGSTIIDDTYSANPRGVMAALDLLDNLKGNKKIVVMYPLIELGEAASDIHRRIAMKLNKICDVCILTNMDFAREIKNNALNTDVFVIQDPKMVIQKLEKIVKSGDIVLLENRIPEKIKNALISS
jgi:UDP-N-acetylmuramoyl-tripeptide--D-alanyl-D-alanine ligase